MSLRPHGSHGDNGVAAFLDLRKAPATRIPFPQRSPPNGQANGRWREACGQQQQRTRAAGTGGSSYRAHGEPAALVSTEMMATGCHGNPGGWLIQQVPPFDLQLHQSAAVFSAQPRRGRHSQPVYRVVLVVILLLLRASSLLPPRSAL
ncbi:unnamed protein product [Lampetra fluviatilis]